MSDDYGELKERYLREVRDAIPLRDGDVLVFNGVRFVVTPLSGYYFDLKLAGGER
jgi:hypothetical protein